MFSSESQMRLVTGRVKRSCGGECQGCWRMSFLKVGHEVLSSECEWQRS